MIIFHEGLPGSGKSYEAVVHQIIPALKKGRQVHAYVAGLDHQRFADVTGLSLEEVKQLLFQVEEEQVMQVYNVPDNVLLVIDELQNFFPVRAKLSDEMTKFVAEHRHRGIDIICMGQDYRDCHALWKRRIDQLIHFVKRDAVGQAKAYTWKSFKQNQGTFVKLRSGKGVYDSQYFGLYKSHVSSDIEADAHSDSRFNIFQSASFKIYIPVFAVIVCFAIYYLYSFFHEPVVTVPAVKSRSNPVSPLPPPAVVPVSVSRSAPDVFLQMLGNNRLRLAGDFRIYNDMHVLLEIVDDGLRVVQRLRSDDLLALGWTFFKSGGGYVFKKDGQPDQYAYSWPWQPIVAGRVSEDEAMKEQLRAER